MPAQLAISNDYGIPVVKSTDLLTTSLQIGLRSRLYLPNEGSLAGLKASVKVRTSNLQVARVDSRLPSRCPRCLLECPERYAILLYVVIANRPLSEPVQKLKQACVCHVTR